MAARFTATYPGMPFVSPAYPTRDGVIPARWFDLWWQNIEHIDAAQVLSRAQGASAGEALAYGKPHESRSAMSRLQREAFPTRRHVITPTPEDPT